MPRFLVEVPIVGSTFYRVEADNEDDAMELVRNGSADIVCSDWDTSPHDEDWNIEID